MDLLLNGISLVHKLPMCVCNGVTISARKNSIESIVIVRIAQVFLVQYFTYGQVTHVQYLCHVIPFLIQSNTCYEYSWEESYAGDSSTHSQSQWFLSTERMWGSSNIKSCSTMSRYTYIKYSRNCYSISGQSTCKLFWSNQNVDY